MKLGTSLALNAGRSSRVNPVFLYNQWVNWPNWTSDAWNDRVLTGDPWQDYVPTQSSWLYPEGSVAAFGIWDDAIPVPIGARLRELERTGTGQVVLAFSGDSWIQGDLYWLQQFTKTLQDAYGLGAIGYVGFQWFGVTSGAWVDGGTQPSGGGAGCSRTDLVAAPVFSGTWTSDNGNQPGGSESPSIGWAETSAASAYVRFTVPAGHTTADLIYEATGSGSVEYSWNGGSTWETAISLTGTAGAIVTVALANIPGAAATLRLRRVSGTIRLCGVNLKSTAPGVVVHKLGASGSTSAHWVAPTVADWATQVNALAPHFFAVLLGTNDQPAVIAPSRTASNLASLMAAIKAANANIDRLVIMPAESIRGTPANWPMVQYAAETLTRSKTDGFALLDLQDSWGPDPAAYAFGQPGSLMDITNGHPATATGGALISLTLRRYIGIA